MKFFVLRLIIFFYLHHPSFGACPGPMKDPCLLEDGFQYTSMCDCFSQPPTYCSSPNQTCLPCMFQSTVCSTVPNSPKCCSILGGQSYCNSYTKKCESIRYCYPGDEKCPFNDLTPAEITNTINIIKNSKLFPTQIQFPVIRTQEPHKSEWIAGNAFTQRLAYANVLDLTTYILSEIVVDLNANSVLYNAQLPGAIPIETINEIATAQGIVRNNPRVNAAYLRRGLNPTFAWIIFWAIGGSGPQVNLPGQRLLRGICYYIDPVTSWSWTPVEGLQLTLDLNTMTITDFVDTGSIPLSPVPLFNPNPAPRNLNSLLITQPNGSSIQISGQQISWYKWRLMYSVDPNHGLQLFHVRYFADCAERLVLYKISVSEMNVPYGASGSQWRWRRAFDLGEYGLGISAVSQVLGVDVPPNTQLLNCTQYDNREGTQIPRTLPGCVAAYERDSGMLYKYVDLLTGNSQGSRGREMVLSFIVNIGSYVYAYEYIFQLDGTLQVNLRLTGVPLPRGVPLTENDPSCIESCIPLVNDYLVDPVHQHYFNFRLDFDVDGPLNYALQSNVVNDPVGPTNPDGGAFSVKKKIIKTESADDYDVVHSKSWQIINANSRNRFQSPRGYAIKPLDLAYSYAHKGNPYLPQAVFVQHPFWVTAYDDSEQGAAGNFPRSGIKFQGLPQYVKHRQSLENQDLVAWYTVGVTHTTRAEEWPIMNVHNAGFSLVPYNFMSQNSEVPLTGSCP